MAPTSLDGQTQETALAGAVDPSIDTNDPAAVHEAVLPAQNPSTATLQRVLAPDLLRGLLMVLQAVDHCSVSLGAWQHGVGLKSEADGARIVAWNDTVPYIARTLTHLCAPGFMFLMGLGIIYLGNSRRQRQGWSAGRFVRHFAVRTLALMLVNQVFFTALAGPFRFWLLNTVLVALAINYFLAGLLWLVLDAAETQLPKVFDRLSGPKDDLEEQPLLDRAAPSKSTSNMAIAWHVNNVVLAILVAATAWLNIAMSPDNGHCSDSSSDDNQLFVTGGYGTFVDFWFYPVATERVVSVFPPLAWLSFVLLGLLYGRIATSRRWSPRALALGTAAAGIACVILFVLTRLLQFGNLTQDCLNLPEQQANPGLNQYLASLRSFFYVAKYPPSVSFFALTMSANFFLLAFFSALPNKLAIRLKPLLVFGTSALFFYVVHMMVYFGFAAVMKAWLGEETGRDDPMTGGRAIEVHSMAAMWITWLVGLAILYPLCGLYGRFKQSKGPDSIWRFF